jgi:UPF0271 protein
MPTDAAIMPFISSANIACGYHAGDADTMKKTVALCMENGVAIGAHPSFADREHFGRREMQLAPEAVEDLILQQLLLMQQVCNAMGATMQHVKPHGALYNMSARQPQLAMTIAKAVHDFQPALKLYGLAGSCSITEAGHFGLQVVQEFFADRTYQPDGSLTPRSAPSALIEEDDQALQQAMLIAREGKIIAVDGKVVFPGGGNGSASICLHGDGAHAVDFARHIHHSLQSAGFSILAP